MLLLQVNQEQHRVLALFEAIRDAREACLLLRALEDLDGPDRQYAALHRVVLRQAEDGLLQIALQALRLTLEDRFLKQLSSSSYTAEKSACRLEI